jgi:hypothetical protein
MAGMERFPYAHPSVCYLFQDGELAYSHAMTKLLDKAFEAVKRLSAAAQDEIARTILHLAENDGEPEAIDARHLPAVLEGLAQARRREFASDDEVEAVFRRFDS